MYVGVEKPDFTYVTKHWGFFYFGRLLFEYFLVSLYIIKINQPKCVSRLEKIIDNTLADITPSSRYLI